MVNKVNPSAGVYTTEEDRSARATAAATSIVATVGEAPMGPVNQIVDLFDDTQLTSIFGTPNAGKYGFALYCAEQALSQTRNLKFLRVVNTDAMTAGAYFTVDDPEQVIPNLRLNVFDDGGNTPKGMWDPFNNLGFTADQEGVESVLLYFCCQNPGVWNDRVSIRIRPSNPAGVELSDERHYNPLHFYVDVFLDYRSVASRPVESFKVSRKYELDGNNAQMFIEDVINTGSQYIRVRNNPFCGDVKIKKETFEFLKGGTDGSRVTDAQIIKGWDEFSDSEAVDVSLLMNSGYTTPAVQRAMLSLAESRGDATAILDLPDADREAARAVDYVTNRLNTSSSYGAIYAPFVQIRDTHNSRSLFIPPSGHVCAAMAYTDYNRAVWFAAAGLSRGTLRVNNIRTKYGQGARDALDRAHINPIRNIPGRGFVIMGQETLQGYASAFSNVNVRRLVNFIKKSIATAANVGVFDPNDGFLRLSLVNLCDDFLKPIKGGRGLYEYSAVCDDRNNTADIIANGDLKLDVYADPTIPTKRIHLTSHLMPTGTYFDENN